MSSLCINQNLRSGWHKDKKLDNKERLECIFGMYSPML